MDGFRTRLLLCLAALLSATPTLAQAPARPAYRSPSDVAFSPDGALLAVADRTWPGLVLIDPSTGAVKREVKLLGDPTHVVWNGTGKVLVAEGNNGTVAEIEGASGAVLRRFAIGLSARGLAVTPDGTRLLTCDRAANKLVVVKLTSGTIASTFDVGREPSTVAVSKDGKLAVVGNKLPRAADPYKGTPAAEISLVDLGSGQVTAVALPKPATMVRQVVLSPDGRWAYVTHQLPRGGLPVTQLDNGWVMTSVLSIIDVAARSLYASLLFDRSGAGAAHPWGAVINSDGSKLWGSLEGVREVATVDLTALHDKLAGSSAEQRLGFKNDLKTLHDSGIIKRTVFKDIDGPRGVALSPDGKALAVSAYFTGQVLLLAPDDLSLSKAITLPDNPTEDEIRKGERFFHSAMYCYQSWLSCSSCHDDGHADGLNWDLQNDGTGNPKQTKSLVFASQTPPSMATGVREDALVATRAGYQYIEFQYAPEERVRATYAYLEALAPEPSPFLAPDGQLTPDAVEGKKLFEGQAGCARCHADQYFTDMKKHDVGTRDPDGPSSTSTYDLNGYDTPGLIEVWRTAPYLHLGNALTIQDAILAHVKTPAFSPQQLDQLAAYVLQIGPTRDRALPVVADAGVPIDAPSAPNDASGSGGQTTMSSGGTGGSVDSASSGAAGQSGATTSGAAGQNGTGTSGAAGQNSMATSGAAGQSGTASSSQQSPRLARGGCSCRVHKASSFHEGSVLTLLGLAWLVRRVRRHPRRW